MSGRTKLASAGAAASALAARAYAAGTDVLRIGLVGCGGRGTANVANCAYSAPGVEIHALGDLFHDRIEGCLKGLQSHEILKDRLKVTPERCFSGWDNHLRVFEHVDLVLLCQPPGFRPMHLRAAIEAGKHVFAEKPVAVDPAGVRSVIETARLAEEKKLAIVAGTQTRHQADAVETMRRVHDGAIGDLRSGACYFLTGELWYHDRKPEWSDMEYQCRNWYYFTWLSGDHIVEQHVHQHDLMNWAFKAPPVKCVATGGRQNRTDAKWGNIWDHFAVEYEYPGGARIMSLCRQANGAADRVDTVLVGSKGVAYPARGTITGENAWTYGQEVPDPSIQEHKALVESIRAGAPLNDGRRIAETSLTSVMGRMAAYTGRELSWKWVMESSKLDLAPPKYEFGPLPMRPVAVPGKTELV
ncbi:MAG: Gfo/Idh/MocA family oxidoreductase [Planctomycetes bacterium]|nr:Gfo/Idh/MocA family oxidoreductase [Planctomycetota bacterium]